MSTDAAGMQQAHAQRAHATPPAEAAGTQEAQAATPSHAHTGAPGYLQTKDAQLKRLRRIEGQIRGLQRLVDNDTYCIDVLTQVSAATKALESFALGLLEEHLSHCVAEALAHGGTEADEKVKEASAAIARLVRS
jgi:DNA-binding FrmR family transcriptional regulator